MKNDVAAAADDDVNDDGDTKKVVMQSSMPEAMFCLFVCLSVHPSICLYCLLKCKAAVSH